MSLLLQDEDLQYSCKSVNNICWDKGKDLQASSFHKKNDWDPIISLVIFSMQSLAGRIIANPSFYYTHWWQVSWKYQIKGGRWRGAFLNTTTWNVCGFALNVPLLDPVDIILLTPSTMTSMIQAPLSPMKTWNLYLIFWRIVIIMIQ